jgi:hypothetical protein
MKTILQTTFTILLFFCVSFVTHAQKSDPYRKPELWEKLKKDPNNRTLWSKYLSKKWSKLGKKDRADVESMKQLLYIEAIAEEESIIGVQKKNVSEEVFKGVPLPKTAPDRKPNELTSVEAKQLAGAEAIIMEEPQEIEELKVNITTNFIILEDKFKEVFESLGMTYRYYHEVHPEGDYSELKWIEEQELRIKLVKKQQVELFRNSYKIIR